MNSIINRARDVYQNSSNFQLMSYIPIASNIAGICNIAKGALTAVAGFFMLISGRDIFGINEAGNASNRSLGAKVMVFGAAFVLRGLTEQVPIIGNLAVAAFDLMTFDYFDMDRSKFA
jgi:hypothetical protein